MAKRNDTSSQITKVNPSPGVMAERPEWMQVEGRAIKGTEELKQYVIVPRIKVIQKQARAETQAKYKIGDVIVSPLGAMLVPAPTDREITAENPGDPLLFTPIFFWTDYYTQNPIELQNAPMIVEGSRTADPKSEVARRAKDKELRQEELKGADGKPLKVGGKQLYVRHIESLNYIIIPRLTQVVDPVVLSFQKGEWFTGSKFAGMIRMRRASLFECIFQVRVTPRSRNGNDWLGLEPDAPSVEGVSGWVQEEAEAKAFEALYEQFHEEHKKSGLQADLSEADDLVDEAAAPPAGQRDM
jgi:hypothetical protein